MGCAPPHAMGRPEQRRGVCSSVFGIGSNSSGGSSSSTAQAEFASSSLKGVSLLWKSKPQSAQKEAAQLAWVGGMNGPTTAMVGDAISPVQRDPGVFWQLPAVADPQALQPSDTVVVSAATRGSTLKSEPPNSGWELTPTSKRQADAARFLSSTEPWQHGFAVAPPAQSQARARAAPWLGALAKPLVSRESRLGLSSTAVVQLKPLRPAVAAEHWSSVQDEDLDPAVASVRTLLAPSSKARAALAISQDVEIPGQPMKEGSPYGHFTQMSLVSTTEAEEDGPGFEAFPDDSTWEEPGAAETETDTSSVVAECGGEDSGEGFSRPELEFMLERPFFGLETILEEDDLEAPVLASSRHSSLAHGPRRSTGQLGPLGLKRDSWGPLKAPEPLSVEMMRPSLCKGQLGSDVEGHLRGSTLEPA